MRLYGLAVRRALMAIIGGPSAGLACGVTLASVLWVGATVPGLSLISGSGDTTNERISISLQSALLGIDDRVGQSSPWADFAAARALGLTPADLQATPRLLVSLSARGVSPAEAPTPLVVGLRNELKRHAPAKTVPVATAAPVSIKTALAPAANTTAPSTNSSPPVASPPAPSPVRPRDRARRSSHSGSHSRSCSGSGASHTRGSPQRRRPPPPRRHSSAYDHRSRRRLAEATGPNGTSVSYALPVAHDDAGHLVPVSCAPSSGSSFPIGSTRVRCTARDAAGNAASLSFAVAVRDTAPPVIQIPPSMSVAATSPDGAVVTYSATATDLVDGAVPAACLPGSGTLFAVGSTQVTCTARDAAGNSASAAFAVTVNGGDFASLSISGHANELVEATGPAGAPVSYTPPVANDSVDGALPATCAPTAGSVFPIGSTQVTCSAQDSSGNVATLSFAVVVRDTTPPVLQVPAALSTPATSVNGAIVSYSASASDLVTSYVEPSCLPASGSLFPVGSTQVTCSAHDDAGNVASSSFTVSVGSLPDTSAPTIAAHADVTAEAESGAGANVTYTAPTATDAVDGSEAVSCLPASGTLFPLGSTTVSCSAQDSAGNSTSVSFAVIVRDTTPPTIAAHADVTAEATGGTGATVTYTPPTAADNLDGAVAVSCLPASGSLFALGSTTVTCSANDAAGNTASSTFAVLVRDTTSPTINARADKISEATSAAGANVTYVTPAATDNLDGPVPLSCLPASGALFALGSTTVTCSAHDAAGNTASSSFTILVRDTTGPTISAHADLTAEAADPRGAIVTYIPPTAADAVDGAVSVGCLPASGNLFSIGSTQVTCSARDAAGNVSGSNFTILVGNSTPPTISAHADVSAEATSAAGANVTYTAPRATDVVDSSVSVDCLPASGACSRSARPPSTARPRTLPATRQAHRSPSWWRTRRPPIFRSPARCRSYRRIREAPSSPIPQPQPTSSTARCPPPARRPRGQSSRSAPPTCRAPRAMPQERRDRVVQRVGR